MTTTLDVEKVIAILNAHGQATFEKIPSHHDDWRDGESWVQHVHRHLRRAEAAPPDALAAAPAELDAPLYAYEDLFDSEREEQP